jgi:hypothetical protein
LLAITLVLPWIGQCGGNYRLLEPNAASARPKQSAADFGRLLLRFERNDGQADPRVKFLCRAAGYTVSLTSTGAVMALSKSFLSIRFPEAEANPQIKAIDALPGTTNYFLGKNPSHWRTSIPSYARVRYRGIYPGIDLVYRGNSRRVECDFIVSPGSDPARVRVSSEGARKIEVDESGDLVLDTPSGPVIQRRPVVWQERDGERREIVSFRLACA